MSFHADPAELLQRYRFGLRTADFLLCRRCGVYIGAQIASARGVFGIINVLAVTPLPGELPVAVPADYSAESCGERIRRREERWTPVE